MTSLEKLLAAAKYLRAAQREYLTHRADEQNVREVYGKRVGEAAKSLDAVIAEVEDALPFKDSVEEKFFRAVKNPNTSSVKAPRKKSS